MSGEATGFGYYCKEEKRVLGKSCIFGGRFLLPVCDPSFPFAKVAARGGYDTTYFI